MVQLPDITTLITEVQALSARVDAWLDQADATVGGYAQLQADLQALQAQVQQLAGSDGTVAAHTHQISEVQGLAAALAAKLDDAAGIIQTHHIANGAITAQHISTTAPPQIPPAFASGWFATSAIANTVSVAHGMSPRPLMAAVELRATADVQGYTAGTSTLLWGDARRNMNRQIYIDDTQITLDLRQYNDSVPRLALVNGTYIDATTPGWEWRLLAW